MPKFRINCVKAAFLFRTQKAAFLLFSEQKERALSMESNDFGDLLLMHLNDDLFWEPKEKPEEKENTGSEPNVD